MERALLVLLLVCYCLQPHSQLEAIRRLSSLQPIEENLQRRLSIVVRSFCACALLSGCLRRRIPVSRHFQRSVLFARAPCDSARAHCRSVLFAQVHCVQGSFSAFLFCFFALTCVNTKHGISGDDVGLLLAKKGKIKENTFFTWFWNACFTRGFTWWFYLCLPEARVHWVAFTPT